MLLRIFITHKLLLHINFFITHLMQQKNGVKSASASISNVSASRGKNEVKEKEDIQGNLF